MSPQSLHRRYGAIAAQYGTGAWELGFPNELDRLRRKTGSGIWIHGTDIDMTPFDTEGCVRFENEVIIYFQQILNIKKTPVIINEELEWVDISFLENEIEIVQSFIDGWLDNWRRQDIRGYLEFYSSDEFISHRQRMNYTAWERHKRRLFIPDAHASIKLYDFNFYFADDLLLVSFLQEYAAGEINDFGRKQLVLRRNKVHNRNSTWKIIQEEWRGL